MPSYGLAILEASHGTASPDLLSITLPTTIDRPPLLVGQARCQRRRCCRLRSVGHSRWSRDTRPNEPPYSTHSKCRSHEIPEPFRKSPTYTHQLQRTSRPVCESMHGNHVPLRQCTTHWGQSGHSANQSTDSRRSCRADVLELHVRFRHAY